MNSDKFSAVLLHFFYLGVASPRALLNIHHRQFSEKLSPSAAASPYLCVVRGDQIVRPLTVTWQDIFLTKTVKSINWPHVFAVNQKEQEGGLCRHINFMTNSR